MDWNNEKESLQKATKWWKPTTGQHKVKFLNDGTEHDFEWDNKIVKKVNFEIEVGGKRYGWGVTKGPTINSLYGQLTCIGVDKGTLVEQEITLIVKGKGKETNYTVLEALELMDDDVVEETV